MSASTHLRIVGSEAVFDRVAPRETPAPPRRVPLVFDEVYRGMKNGGLTPRSSDGSAEGSWVIADYLDVVLHVFTPEARAYYKLEDLWGDVPEVELETAATG